MFLYLKLSVHFLFFFGEFESVLLLDCVHSVVFYHFTRLTKHERLRLYKLFFSLCFNPSVN